MASSRFRLLVVDDEPSINEVTSAVLVEEGYEVQTAKDEFDALRLLSEPLPDLIISDLRMPNMSGFEFLTVVRQRFPHIPVIAISGDFAACNELPAQVFADACLQKGGYRIDELYDTITELLYAHPIRPRATGFSPQIVRRDAAGYLLMTCTNCLRTFPLEASGANGGIHGVKCPSCQTVVEFQIDHRFQANDTKPTSHEKEMSTNSIADF